MLSKLALITVLGLTAGTLPALAGSDDKSPPPAPLAPPPDAPLGVSLTVGYDSDYVFRGLETAKNLVTGDVDYTVPINSILSVDLNVWYGSSANDSAVPWAGGGSYEELRLSPSLLAKLGPVTVGVKYTYFDYLGHAGHYVQDVNETGVVLAYSLAGLDLGFYGAYDATARGFYFEYTAAYPIKITEWLSLVPAALISNANNYYGVSGANNITLSLSAPIKLCKSATLSPYIAGNLPIGSLKDTGELDRVYGGVSLTVKF